jgi:hypothetical protein
MILITMDTLALPSETVGTRKPSVEGRGLWNMLFQQYNGSIVLIADGRDDKDHLEHWLKSEGFKPSMLDYSVDSTPREKVRRATQLRNAFGNVRWFVDVDPYSAQLALEEGLPTLIAVAPSVPRTEWRSDRVEGNKPWDTLVEEIDRQRLMRAEANWGEIE